MQIPPVLDRFIDLMVRFGDETNELVAWHDRGDGPIDEALAIFERLRVTAKEARALLPELAAGGSSVAAVDGRLVAIDLSLDRYIGLARDNRVEDSMSVKIGEHAAFLTLVGEHLQKRRDDSFRSGLLRR